MRNLRQNAPDSLREGKAMNNNDSAAKWSYFSLVIKIRDVPALSEGLNRLGREGWELVSSTSTIKTWINLTGNDLLFVFKKQGDGITPSSEALKAIGRINRSGVITYGQASR
jgi:hypothetical protein